MWSGRKQQFRQDAAAGWQDSRQQDAESVLQRLSVLQMLRVQVVLQKAAHTAVEQRGRRTERDADSMLQRLRVQHQAQADDVSRTVCMCMLGVSTCMLWAGLKAHMG
jgi:hypothetical protein